MYRLRPWPSAPSGALCASADFRASRAMIATTPADMCAVGGAHPPGRRDDPRPASPRSRDRRRGRSGAQMAVAAERQAMPFGSFSGGCIEDPAVAEGDRDAIRRARKARTIRRGGRPISISGFNAAAASTCCSIRAPVPPCSRSHRRWRSMVAWIWRCCGWARRRFVPVPTTPMTRARSAGWDDRLSSSAMRREAPCRRDGAGRGTRSGAGASPLMAPRLPRCCPSRARASLAAGSRVRHLRTGVRTQLPGSTPIRGPRSFPVFDRDWEGAFRPKRSTLRPFMSVAIGNPADAAAKAAWRARSGGAVRICATCLRTAVGLIPAQRRSDPGDARRCRRSRRSPKTIG